MRCSKFFICRQDIKNSKGDHADDHQRRGNRNQNLVPRGPSVGKIDGAGRCGRQGIYLYNERVDSHRTLHLLTDYAYCNENDTTPPVNRTR